MKLKLLGVLLLMVLFASGTVLGSSLTLERVEGLYEAGKLPIDETIVFYIRMTNTEGVEMRGIINGFRLHSEDGAEWTSTVGDTLATLDWATIFPIAHIIENSVFSVTGSGADTIGFNFAGMGGGLPADFDDTAYTLTIGPIAAAHHGKTICLDSSFYPPSGLWKWAAGGGDNYFPDWDGPHCYTVYDPAAKPSFVADPVEVVWDLDQIQPANVDVVITDSDASGISFTLAKSQDWLVIDPDVGTTPQTITCSLVVDILVTGQMYYDTIWVTSDDAGNSPFAVPCSVYVIASDVELYGGENRPTSFTLSQNYPNPFNPRTQIRFDLPVRTHVSLTVFNVLGQQVNALVDEVLPRGQYVVDWDGADQSGSAVSSGIYFYRIEAETFTETRKMVLLK